MSLNFQWLSCRRSQQLQNTATISQSAQIAAWILRRRTERKLEGMLGDRFGLREGKGIADATRMLRITPGRTLDTEEELWVCFIGRQKASDRVKWMESMQILKGTDIGWRERRLLSKLYMDQCVKLKLDQRHTKRVNSGR
jgi:hypothetical protein